MDLFSMQFLAALAAIVVIDLVLAGDNAIVIALAARNLEPRLRKRAILWGTFGAIAVRAAMTLVVVWLLKVPGLMFFAGLMLLWIAYRLLVPKHDAGDGHEVRAASGFWAAMATIVIADAMMGLDNVLAVAGAAHGSYLLVVLGLVISIPIVVAGSRLVLGLIDRFPAIIYVGAAVLALTAAKMISAEPAIALAFADQGSLLWTLYIALGGGVLALAFLRTRFRDQERMRAQLLDESPPAGPMAKPARILVPVDGSRRTLDALKALAQRMHPHARPQIHLVSVQSALPARIAAWFGGGAAARQRERAMQAVASASELLTRCGVSSTRHVRQGEPAEVIAALAQTLECDRIVLAAAPRNSLMRLIEDGLIKRLLARTRVPLQVVASRHGEALERIGIPLSLAALLAFAVLAD